MPRAALTDAQKKTIAKHINNKTAEELAANMPGIGSKTVQKHIDMILASHKLKEENTLDDAEPEDLASMEIEVDDDGGLNQLVASFPTEVDDEPEAEITRDTEIDIDIDDTPLVKPIFNSPLWSDYVKQQLTDDELRDGYPTADGLRRLVEELIGPIVSRRITHIKFPTALDNSATVAIYVQCKVLDENHPAYQQVIGEESVSDANEANNSHQDYSSHMSAVAETRAEGRVYRKLLRLKNAVSAEEVTSGDVNLLGKSNVASPITDVQIVGIDRICERLDINVMDFVNCGGELADGNLVSKTYTSIEEVTSEKASNILNKLNAISSEGEQKPNNVGPYDKSWRS